MKNDESQLIRHDFTAYVEKFGIYLEVTYDTEYLRHRRVTGNDRIDIDIEWVDVTPIKVHYSDVNDNEISWMYGENMHHKIVNALERFEGLLLAEITAKAKETT